MRALIAVVSCHSRLKYQQCIRETWLPLVKSADVRFFLGPSERLPKNDEVFLECDDSYHGLPSKVRAIVRWALEKGYDYVLKCDDDVVLMPEQMLQVSGFNYYDFSGHKNDDRRYPVPFGFCYWLSRRSMLLIGSSELPSDNNDEVWVTTVLSKEGIILHHDIRYVMHVGKQEDFVPKKSLPIRAPLRRRVRPKPDMFSDGTQVFAKCMYIIWSGYHGTPDDQIISEMKKVFEAMRVQNT
jgi:hypothetical protein